LVDQLLALGPSQIGPIVRLLLPLGNFALEEIARSFPGPLWPSCTATDSRLPRPEEISGPASALVAFGEEAVPYLAHLMRHASPRTRYYAALTCSAWTSARLVDSLSQAALDEDRECRRLALHLLSRYHREPRYRRTLSELRGCASDVARPLSLRRRAISALTRLRDEASAPLFVDLLASSDRGIATACRVGLRVLTAHDFGFAREPWLRWLAERGREARTEWLIEGLGDSRANIRLLASRELWQLTRFLQPLSEKADRSAFLHAKRSYEGWWSRSHPR
jgi:HEAT repeat protein